MSGKYCVIGDLRILKTQISDRSRDEEVEPDGLLVLAHDLPRRLDRLLLSRSQVPLRRRRAQAVLGAAVHRARAASHIVDSRDRPQYIFMTATRSDFKNSEGTAFGSRWIDRETVDRS